MASLTGFRKQPHFAIGGNGGALGAGVSRRNNGERSRQKKGHRWCDALSFDPWFSAVVTKNSRERPGEGCRLVRVRAKATRSHLDSCKRGRWHWNSSRTRTTATVR